MCGTPGQCLLRLGEPLGGVEKQTHAGVAFLSAQLSILAAPPLNLSCIGSGNMGVPTTRQEPCQVLEL